MACTFLKESTLCQLPDPLVLCLDTMKDYGEVGNTCSGMPEHVFPFLAFAYICVTARACIFVTCPCMCFRTLPRLAGQMTGDSTCFNDTCLHTKGHVTNNIASRPWHKGVLTSEKPYMFPFAFPCVFVLCPNTYFCFWPWPPSIFTSVVACILQHMGSMYVCLPRKMVI